MAKSLHTWTNLRGWRGRRPLVVFESDDWGAIRLKDQATRDSLISYGLDLDKWGYDQFDCLENRSDLNELFGVLSAHRDSQGRSPIFTFNVVMGNPDFEAIASNEYQEFVHERLFDSYIRYYGDDLRSLWQQASQEYLIKPQFHAREHINIELWLQDLRANKRETRFAFEHEYFGLTTQTSAPRQQNYLAAFWPLSPGHLCAIQSVVKDGLNMFQQEFGFYSRSMVACNYVLPTEVEATLATKGVELIQGQRGQRLPSPDGKTIRVRRSHTGKRNERGQYYSVRNVQFEPFEDRNKDWVSSALREIAQAFYWRTPAIISTHRVNYVSGLSLGHRDRNLKLLNDLLTKILARWPDTQFVSSDELLDKMLA